MNIYLKKVIGFISNIRWFRVLTIPLKFIINFFSWFFRSETTLSYSKVSTYLTCPLKYKFLYVQGRKQKPSKHLSFGSTIHRTLCEFHKCYRINSTDINTLLKIYDKQWINEGYDSKEEENEFKQRGKKILEDYFFDNKTQHINPIKFEEKITIKTAGVTLTGIIDRIDRRKDGMIEIIDYKTGRRIIPQGAVSSNLQANIYYLLVCSAWKKKVANFWFYFLEHRQRIPVKLRPEEIKSTEKLLKTVNKNIYYGNFPLHKGALCGWCDFQSECPGWNGYTTDKTKFRLSYSKLHLYLLCPRQYKFLYVDKVAPLPKPFFSIGTTIHNTLEEFYNYDGYFHQPSLRYLLKLYKKHWISAGYKDAEEEKEYFDNGITMLKNYYAEFVEKKFVKAYLTEAYFELPIGNNYLICGYIDRIEKNPVDGSFELIDYKTNPTLPTQEEVDNNLQLTLYFWAAKEAFGITPKKLSFYFLQFNKKISTERTEKDIQHLIEIVNETGKKMQTDKEFLPKLNKYCCHCDYQTDCPLIEKPLKPSEVFDERDVKELEMETTILDAEDGLTEKTKKPKTL